MFLEFSIIESIENALNMVKQASILEFSTKKPGNVGPSQSVKGISLKDYERVIGAITRSWGGSDKIENNGSAIISKKACVGRYSFIASKTMMQTPPHQNLLLGYVLLISPLICSLKKLRSQTKEGENLIRISWKQFWDMNKTIITEASYKDSVSIAKAISIANPGGLSNPGGEAIETEYDLMQNNFITKIKADKLKLMDFFAESASFDLISKQYTTNFEFCREIIENWVLKRKSQFFKPFSSSSSASFSSFLDSENLNRFVVALFIHIMAKAPDSLIFRKNNIETAKNIQLRAKEIDQLYSKNFDTQNDSYFPKIEEKIEQFNQFLLDGEGKLNPGTSADLTGCILFLCLLFSILENHSKKKINERK